LKLGAVSSTWNAISDKHHHLKGEHHKKTSSQFLKTILFSFY